MPGDCPASGKWDFFLFLKVKFLLIIGLKLKTIPTKLYCNSPYNFCPPFYLLIDLNWNVLCSQNRFNCIGLLKELAKWSICTPPWVLLASRWQILQLLVGFFRKIINNNWPGSNSRDASNNCCLFLYIVFQGY